jgi:hypothetical protein
MEKAILFIIFNRPDTTEEVFAAIRKARPPRLYVAADGARSNHENDKANTRKARNIINLIDWPCEVNTLFQPKNLGPMYAQEAAIDWFFQTEEDGIILEDDTLPAPSFFSFCETLLDKYHQQEDIFMISGNNFQAGKVYGDGDYYFSNYTHTWGWATWRRSWEKYDREISSWPSFRKKKYLTTMHAKNTERYWTDIFNAIHSKKLDRGWDYRFNFSCWLNKSKAILPNVNLVTNIGFGPNATNCKELNSPFSNMTVKNIVIPLTHPTDINISYAADAKTSLERFNKASLLQHFIYFATHPMTFIPALKRKLGEKL